MKGELKKWYLRALDLIYPRRCPFCDDLLSFGDTGICDNCKRKIGYVGQNYCMKCGKQLKDDSREYCRDCERTAHIFDRGRSLYVYDDIMKESIARFKYGGRQEYAEYYAEDILCSLKGFIDSCRPDALIPVPISDNKYIKRGYNQAELIARSLSAKTGLPVNDKIIVRSVDTLPMKELTRNERMKNLKGAFKIASVDVKCRNVLIIDDIYTTGSTIDAMSAVLKTAGVKKVCFVTLSSGTTL